jgi:hypothetical protein
VDIRGRLAGSGFTGILPASKLLLFCFKKKMYIIVRGRPRAPLALGSAWDHLDFTNMGLKINMPAMFERLLA